MQTSTEWLADYLDPVPSTQEAGERLTMAGFPVEEVSQVAGVDVMDVEITSNRPDLFCHVGVAREIAALTGGAFTLPEANPPEAAESAVDRVKVVIEANDLCPHYTARVLTGLSVKQAPEVMRRRLEQLGLRPISNLVDVTNYVLFELGQPLHAFDLDKLVGDTITVRLARKGESIRTLDGVDRKLTTADLVIADGEGPVALAGVMGGERTEVSETTTNVLLESARFDALSVRTTSRRLKLMSDSSFRFERGLDPTLAHRASLRAAQLMLETAGGTLLAGAAEAGSDAFETLTPSLRWSALERLLGTQLDREAVTKALAGLGLSPKEEADRLVCTVPSHRLDITKEVDLIEEAARVVGYDAIPMAETIDVRVKPADVRLVAEDTIRDAAVAAGYFEAITFSFVDDGLKDFFLADGTSLRRVDPNVRKADGHLRPSILPGLVQAIRHNESVGNGPVRVFEVGSVFWQAPTGPVEERRLALAGGDFATLRGTIDLLLARLDADRAVSVRPSEAAGYAKGAAGEIVWGDTVVGHIGLLSKDVQKHLDLQHQPAIAELVHDPLVAGFEPAESPPPLSRFPSARRDVSFVVAEDVTYAQLADLAAAEPKLADVVAVEHGGTYRGKPLEKGTKSVTLTLVFRRDDATVPRDEADAQVATLVQRAGDAFEATLRA
ncbi:MAG: phenylalanine--tRNA ligase subunit beta [Planctomycetota bacterium]